MYGYAGIEVLRPGATSGSAFDEGREVERVWEGMGGRADAGSADDGGVGDTGKSEGAKGMSVLEMFYVDAERVGLYGAVREGMRRWITKGWWVGPRMEAKIRILKRVP